jgi:tetratricopeptide (TPR) repeat protein
MASQLGLSAPVGTQETSLANTATDTFTLNALNPQQLNRLRAEAYKDKGNDYFLLQRYDQAIAEYLKALYAAPNYTDAYYNLGKVYLRLNDSPRATEAFERLVTLDPTDHETRVLLAQQYLAQGQASLAMLQLLAVVRAQPTNDAANRLLRFTQHSLLASQQPQVAAQQLQRQATQQWQQAKGLVLAFLRSKAVPQAQAQTIVATLGRLHYQFTPPTNTTNGGDTMAEYDHEAMPNPEANTQGLIRIKPELAFASPNVLGAYLIHELVHATDGDAISSIREEQDAYRLQAQFWLANKGDTLESNLDLGANLYDDSVDKLDQEVRRSYSSNRLLPEKSPGHGLPLTSAGLATYEQERLAALKSYEMERIKALF